MRVPLHLTLCMGMTKKAHILGTNHARIFLVDGKLSMPHTAGLRNEAVRLGDSEVSAA